MFGKIIIKTLSIIFQLEKHTFHCIYTAATFTPVYEPGVLFFFFSCFLFLSLVCMPGPSGYLHTNAERQHLESVFFGKFLCEWSTTCGCKHCSVHARSLVCATEPPVVASEDKQTNNQEKGLTTT